MKGSNPAGHHLLATDVTDSTAIHHQGRVVFFKHSATQQVSETAG